MRVTSNLSLHSSIINNYELIMNAPLNCYSGDDVFFTHASSDSRRCCASIPAFVLNVCGKRLFSAAIVVMFCCRLITSNVMAAPQLTSISDTMTATTTIERNNTEQILVSQYIKITDYRNIIL